MEVSLGKTFKNPSQALMKPIKDIDNVSCRRDMTEVQYDLYSETIQGKYWKWSSTAGGL